jgi:serine/threonine-protein kinase RsbW
MSDESEICVTSQLTKLEQISQFVADRAVLAGMDEDQAFAVGMAVDEACTNAIEHAYEGREEGEVHVCCSIEGDDFVVRVIDHGKPFDPSSVPVPDITAPLEERQIGGLGIYLMKKLMDSVEFRFDEALGNQVTMRKRRKVAGA